MPAVVRLKPDTTDTAVVPPKPDTTDVASETGSVRLQADLTRCWGWGRRRGGALRRALILDVVLLHLAVEGRPVQAEDLCGFLLVPIGPLQRLHDRHLLDFGERTMRGNGELLRRTSLFADRLRQIGRLNLSGLADQHGTLDGVFQLADVARPAVADEQVIRRRRDRLHVFLIALVELRQEVVAEQRNVLAALAQRRHAQRDGVDAEVQVLAQLS